MNLDDVFKLYPRWNDPELAENDDPLKLDYHLTAVTKVGTVLDIEAFGDRPEINNRRLTFINLREAAKIPEYWEDKTIIYGLAGKGIHFFTERWAGNEGERFVLGRDGAKAVAALQKWYKDNYFTEPDYDKVVESFES